MKDTYFVKREMCPACEHTAFTKLYTIGYNSSTIKKYLKEFYEPQGGIEFAYLDGADFVLQECKNCNLIFQEYIPNDFLMGKLYEEWIDPKIVLPQHENYHLKYFQKLSNEVANIIAYFKTTPRNLNFLDFGMGWGQWLLMVKAYGVNAFGMELSKDRIEHAKENCIKTMSWYEAPRYSLDFINTEQVFEHVSNPLKTLRHLISSLRPNGLIKISVPNGNVAKRNLKIMDWSASKQTRNSLNIIAPLEHINCFRTKSIKIMAGLAGLQQETVSFNHLTTREMLKHKIKPFYNQLFRGGKEGTYLFFKKP